MQRGKLVEHHEPGIIEIEGVAQACPVVAARHGGVGGAKVGAHDEGVALDLREGLNRGIGHGGNGERIYEEDKNWVQFLMEY